MGVFTKILLGVGAYVAISALRSSKAIAINKDTPAGKVLDDAANTGDQLIEVAGQAKQAVAAKIGNEAPAGTRDAESADAAALSTIF